MPVYTSDSPLRVVVLISGEGTNLQAIIDTIKQEHIPAQIVAVISNNPQAPGLTRARKTGIPADVINHKDYDNRTAYDRVLMRRIDSYTPGLVVLAGFMRILTDEFVNHYQHRMMNIHPSLLPKYRGLHTHQRALDAGDKEHGCTVHFVTSQLDGGPIVIQAKVPVLNEDDAASLEQRVHQQEYRIYPQAIRWFAEGRLSFNNETLLFDGQPLTAELGLGHSARTNAVEHCHKE